MPRKKKTPEEKMTEMQEQPVIQSIPAAPLPASKPKPQMAITVSKRTLAIPDVEKAILSRVDELISGMFDLALGHYHQVNKFDPNTGTVEVRVYEVDPDYKALSFLLENVLGKVPQRIEMTGEDGGPIRIVPWMTMAEAIRMKLRDVQEEEEPEDDEDTIEGELVPDGE